MNSIGVHVLVWTGESALPDIRQAMAASAACGYDFLELSLHQLDELDVAGIRAASAECDLKITCSRGLSFDADISSEDITVVSRGADLLTRSIDATARLGSSILTGPLFGALGKYPGPMSRAGRANAIGVLREAAIEAARLDVTLGLEVCNRYETNVVNTAADALNLIDGIGQDNVVVHLDTYHMNIEEDNLYQPIIDAGQRLGYVHVGENHRGPLGSGHVDLGTVFQALSAIGYSGPIAFESFSSRVVSRGLSGDLAIWRDLWTDNLPMASAACGYLRSALRGIGNKSLDGSRST
jgi:D-psicose/D-tagatose/L-ribulose 3-epimerase